MLVESKISGIPCTIDVHHYNVVEGSFSYNADSDWDYFGYVDADYTICDRRGRPAIWLENKMTAEDKINVEQDISDACNFAGYHQ